MKKTHGAFLLVLALFLIHARCFPPRIGGDGRLSIVGRYNIDMAYGFDIKEDFAYLGTNRGLLILDISDPGHPERVAELELGFVKDVTVIDGTAYLCGGANGFILADVSDVRKPSVIGQYRDQGEIYGFAKSGSHAFLCDRLEGIKVIDITNPRNPKKTGQWSNGGQYWEIEIRDRIAYAADSRDGLELLDISDPDSLRLIAIVPNTQGAVSVTLEDERLCLGTFSGIKVFDLEESRNPRPVIRILDDQEVLSGCLAKNLLFAGAHGIAVFDIAGTDAPIRLANWTIRGGVHGIVCRGEYIYTAKMGFYILKL